MALFKADIDSAFRRVPITPGKLLLACAQPRNVVACLLGHRRFAAIAYKLDGQIHVAMHNALPFGSAASVAAWHRVGALLRAIGRKLLHLVLLQYVDDFYGPDHYEAVEHAMQAFARQVALATVVLC